MADHYSTPDLRTQFQDLDRRLREVERRTSTGAEDWHLIGAAGEPAFKNSWANLAGQAPAAFYKDPNGRVWVQGVINSGASGSVAFTLPYLPGWSQYRGLLLDGAVAGGSVHIDPTTGDVAVTRGASANAYLDFSYRAA